MPDENGYNGWANRDTWNSYNWLTSYYSMYKAIVDLMLDSQLRFRPEILRTEYGEWLSCQDGINILVVNWRELAEAFTEE